MDEPARPIAPSRAEGHVDRELRGPARKPQARKLSGGAWREAGEEIRTPDLLITNLKISIILDYDWLR